MESKFSIKCKIREEVEIPRETPATAEQLKKSPREILEAVGRREETLEQLLKAWPITIGDTGLQEMKSLVRCKPDPSESEADQLITAWKHELEYIYRLKPSGQEKVLEYMIPYALTILAESGPETEEAKEILKNWKLKLGTQKGELSQSLPGGPSTQEVINAYLEDCRFRRCSQRTICNYGNFLYRALGPFDQVPTDHKVIRRILSNFKGETMITYRRYLFGFYRFLQEEYELATPMTKVPKPREERRIPDHLNPEQKRQLKEAKLNPRDRVLINLFAESAVRPGEVDDSHGHPLRFCDIYEDHIEVAGKRGERIVPVTAETRDSLFALQGSRLSDSPVFLGNNSRALTHWGIRKIVKRAFAAAGIRGVKACPYTLRHSFGGDFLAQGGDLAILQRILGHANIKTTMIYTHIADKAVMSSYREHGPRAINHPLFALNEEVTSPSDAARLIPELLDKLIALGQVAQEVSHALGGNGHRPEQLEKIKQYLVHQANK